MKTNVYRNAQARQYLPEIVGDDNAIVVGPVRDTIISGDDLGILIIFPDCQTFQKDGKFTGCPLNEAQRQRDIKGSFIFIGSNPKYFHHLIKSRISGKIMSKGIMIDDAYKGLVSNEFIYIIKQNIADYV